MPDLHVDKIKTGLHGPVLSLQDATLMLDKVMHTSNLWVFLLRHHKVVLDHSS